MVNQFKFLQSNDATDYVHVGQPEPPFGISRRHWNMMPQDLRDGAHENRIYYMMGWEAARDANYNNPYTDTEPAELWNRGWHAWWERRNRGQNFNNVNPNPPIDETYPEFYNTDELIFFDVTEVRYDEETYVPYKQMLFRHIEEGNTIEGDRIQFDHPMYNFPDII
jgi:hypothetical protein